MNHFNINTQVRFNRTFRDGGYIVPPSISSATLKLLYDFSQDVTVDGSNNVSEAEDLTGNGYKCSQSTGSDQPLFDGTDLVTLNGTTDWLDLSAHIDSFKNDTDGEVIVVGSGEGAQVNQVMLYFGEGATNKVQFQHDVPDTLPRFFTNTGTNEGTTSQWADDTIAIVSYNKTSMRVNGNAVVTGSDRGWFSQVPTPDLFQIGRFSTDVVLYPIRLKSLLIYNASLSAGDRDTVFTHLNNRFTVY